MAFPSSPHDPSMPYRGGKAPKATGDTRSYTGYSTATGPHPPPPPALTDAQLIQQWVTAAQLPGIQAIQNAQAQSQAQARLQAQQVQGYYAALASILQGIGPQTRAGYQQAAGADSAFGKGFSDGLAHVQGKAQGQSDAALSAAGAPASQHAQATGDLGGTGATDALYALGGYIPATTMSREGAAFGAANDRLPFTAAGQGADMVKNIFGQENTAEQGFAKQLADLAAQAPGLALQIGQQLDTRHAQEAAAAERTREFGIGEQDKKRQQQISYILATGVDPSGNLTPKARAELASAMGYDPVTGKPTASTKYKAASLANADKRLTLAEQKQLSEMYGVDAKGNLTIAGRKQALAEWKAQHPKKSGGYTDALKAKLQDQAAKLADLYYYGTPDKKDAAGAVTKAGIGAVPDYQKALRLELSHGVPLSYALKALNALYPAGTEGRPWVDIQERWALEQAGMPMTNPMMPPTVAQAKWLRAHGYNYGGRTIDGPGTVQGKTG